MTLAELEEKKAESLKAIADAADAAAVEALRIAYVGRNGSIPALIKGMKDVPKEERPAFGKAVQAWRAEVEAALAAKGAGAAGEKPVDADLTLPAEGVLSVIGGYAFYQFANKNTAGDDVDFAPVAGSVTKILRNAFEQSNIAGEIIGLSVDVSTETTGIGSKAGRADYVDRFIGLSGDISGQHGCGSVLSHGSCEGQNRSGGDSRSRCWNHDSPEDVHFRHAQCPACIDKIGVDLLKCSTRISIHKRERDDCCCQDTAEPGMYDLNVQLLMPDVTMKSVS